jgi:oligosaccharyltransferase complex subunit gamma
MASGLLAVIFMLRLILPILASRWIWAALIICSSIVFTSGIMFVRIRGTPWVGQNKQGSSWLAAGYQTQYGMEVQVMAGVCEGLRHSSIFLMLMTLQMVHSHSPISHSYSWFPVSHRRSNSALRYTFGAALSYCSSLCSCRCLV